MSGKSAMEDLDDLLAELKTPRHSQRSSQPPLQAQQTLPPSSTETRSRADSVDALLEQLAAPSARPSFAPPPAAPQEQTQQYTAPAPAPTPTPTAVPAPSPAPVAILSPEQEERALLEEFNVLRRNPAAYADILQRDRVPYYRGRSYSLPGTNVVTQTQETVDAVHEAIQVLR